MPPHIINNRKYDLPIIICISIVILFIFSKNSWLYSTNDWVDANAFMTVGNAWNHGIIPYRDIFEQKGPFIYIIYGLAAKTGLWFHGIFILETVLMAISLWLLNRSFYLLSDNRFKINITLLIYIIGFVFAPYFDKGGGVEEIATVAIVYLLYLLTYYYKNKSLHTSQLIIVAILFSVIFWIKYSMILAYVILACAYLVHEYLNKNFQKISQFIFINILVLGLVSAVIMIYFAIHSGLDDLINVYFVDNIFKYYGNNIGNTKNHLVIWFKFFTPILLMFMPIMFISIFKRKNKLISNILIISLVLIIILNFSMSNNFLYYSLIVYPIIIYLLFISNLSVPHLILAGVLLSLYVLISSPTPYGTAFSKYKSPAQIVAKSTHNYKDIVQVGVLDSGIYNITKSTPPNHYFQLNNINPILMPELIDEPLRTIKHNHPKYVLTTKSLYETKKNTAFKSYKPIKAFAPYNNNAMPYYILQLKGN